MDDLFVKICCYPFTTVESSSPPPLRRRSAGLGSALLRRGVCLEQLAAARGPPGATAPAAGPPEEPSVGPSEAFLVLLRPVRRRSRLGAARQANFAAGLLCLRLCIATSKGNRVQAVGVRVGGIGDGWGGQYMWMSRFPLPFA